MATKRLLSLDETLASLWDDEDDDFGHDEREDDEGEGVEVCIWQKSPEKSPEKQPQTGDSDSECSQLPVRADMEVPGESSIILSRSQTLNGKLVWLCKTNNLGIDPKMIFFSNYSL